MADDSQPDDAQAPDLDAFLRVNWGYFQGATGIGSKMDWVTNAALSIVGGTLGLIIRLFVKLIGPMAVALMNGLEQSNPEVGELASKALGVIFGSEVAGNVPTGSLNPANLREGAGAVGDAVLHAIFGDIVDVGAGQIEPGTDRAAGYLGTITQIVTRGFVLDIISEFFPEMHFEFITHLEEQLISGLGLGRITRRVLSPFVTTLVSDPAQWAINLAYRPKLLSEGVAIKQFLGGQWSSAQLDDELGRQGYSSDRIDALVSEHAKRLSVDELQTLVDHQLVDEGEAIRRIALLGFDTSGANEVWQAARFRRLNGLVDQAARVWLDKYSSGLIDRELFVNSLSTLGLPDDVAQLIVNIGGAHVETPRRLLSVSELKDAWNKQLLTQNEVHDYIVRLGYSEDDATTLVLLNLTTVRDKAEADQAKKEAAAARAAALTEAKAAAAAKREADRAAAAQQQRAKAAALAARKATILRDQLALKQFAADAAAQKQALVADLQNRGLILADTAQLAKEQIAADEQELLATIAGQLAESKAAYDRQLLELRQTDRELTIQQQLDDVDVALEADQATRSAAVTVRADGVKQALAGKLADLATISDARAASIDQDLADGLAAIDAATLPTAAERIEDARAKVGLLDSELARKLSDIAAHADDERAANDAQLADGLIKQSHHDLEVSRIALSETQAARLAQQQHDISVARLQAIAEQADALAVDEAMKRKTALETRAAAAHKALAGDRVKQELAARHAADVETIALGTIARQIVPITEAEAARRRAKINAAAASAQRAEQVIETEIAKGEADARAAIEKAASTVAALKQKLAQTRAAAGAREGAQQSAAAAIAALDATLARGRLALEAQLASDQAGIDAAMPVSEPQ